MVIIAVDYIHSLAHRGLVAAAADAPDSVVLLPAAHYAHDDGAAVTAGHEHIIAGKRTDAGILQNDAAGTGGAADGIAADAVDGRRRARVAVDHRDGSRVVVGAAARDGAILDGADAHLRGTGLITFQEDRTGGSAGNGDGLRGLESRTAYGFDAGARHGRARITQANAGAFSCEAATGDLFNGAVLGYQQAVAAAVPDLAVLDQRNLRALADSHGATGARGAFEGGVLDVLHIDLGSLDVAGRHALAVERAAVDPDIRRAGAAVVPQVKGFEP